MQVEVTFASRGIACDHCEAPLLPGMMQVRVAGLVRSEFLHFACFRNWAISGYENSVGVKPLEFHIQIRSNMTLLPSEINDEQWFEPGLGVWMEMTQVEEWKVVPRT